MFCLFGVFVLLIVFVSCCFVMFVLPCCGFVQLLKVSVRKPADASQRYRGEGFGYARSQHLRHTTKFHSAPLERRPAAKVVT